MWPFILTRTLTAEKHIVASKTDVLSVLHDPQKVLANNDMAESVVQDPSDPSWYTITDRLPLIGSWATHTTTRTRWTTTPDGCDVEVYANLWTRLDSELRVRELEASESTVVYYEKVVVKALFLFMPYIVSTIIKGHRDAMNTLAAKLESMCFESLPEVSTNFFARKLKQFKKMSFSFGIVYTGYLNSFSLTCIGLFFVPLSCLYMQRHHSNDPYGLFHLSLNKLPFEDSNSLPETEWLNMGYWKDAKTFPEACKALALKMTSAANLKEGSAVLDVGHGTGESLLLLLSDPSVPRPSHLIGITSLDIHHNRSCQRVAQLQAGHQNKIPVDLYHRDAVFNNSVPSTDPLNPSSAITFDSILALDCAYHFNTRHKFLEQSFQKLKPGGSTALADICFLSSSLNTRRTRWITSIVNLIPRCNQISIEDYVTKMEQVGYVDVILEDVTSEVFPGFIVFLKSRGWGWWAFGYMVDWYSSTGARFVIVSGRRPHF